MDNIFIIKETVIKIAMKPIVLFLPYIDSISLQDIFEKDFSVN